MVTSAVPPQVNESLRGNVMNEPTDFVSMCFNHNLVLGLRIYYPYSGSIRIDKMFVDVRF